MADRSRCFGLKAVGNASLGVDRLSEAMSHSRRREDHAMELDEAEELEAEDALAVLVWLHMLLQPSMLSGICESEIEVVWVLSSLQPVVGASTSNTLNSSGPVTCKLVSMDNLQNRLLTCV